MRISRREFVQVTGVGLAASVAGLSATCWSPCGPGWESIGPVDRPGRTNHLAIDPTNADCVFAGTAGGGVFKTTNRGKTWKPKWEEQLSLAIGGLALAPSNPDVIYASTGQWNILRPMVLPGAYVYRSQDGGETWTLRGQLASEDTAAIAIHPTDPNLIYVAGNRHLHRSTDGGITWTHVRDGAVRTVILDPTHPSRIYVGVLREGVFRSDDAGASWMHLTGLPTGNALSVMNIGLGRHGLHGSRFVAAVVGGQVFTSIDGGDTAFVLRSGLGGSYSLVPYAKGGVVAVDPTDENVLFRGDTMLSRSPDGGISWAPVASSSTMRDLWTLAFDPRDSGHMYAGSDFGILESINNGRKWTLKSNGLINTLCWTVGVSQAEAPVYGASSHDQGAFRLTSTSTPSEYLGGEGGWLEIDPTNPKIMYVDGWDNCPRAGCKMTRWEDQTPTELTINTARGYVPNLPPNDPGWWEAPWREALTISRPDHNFLLAIENTGKLARSINGGTTWEEVLSVPGEIISAVKIASSDDSHAYAATATGSVFRSSQHGRRLTWTLISDGSLLGAWIQAIEVDPRNPLRVYLVCRANCGRPIWLGETGANGQVNWLDRSGDTLVGSLPPLEFTGLALDDVGGVYVSCIRGVYRSLDDGRSWRPFDRGLPNAVVTDIDIHLGAEPALYVSTWGRGLYRRKLTRSVLGFFCTPKTSD